MVGEVRREEEKPQTKPSKVCMGPRKGSSSEEEIEHLAQEATVTLVPATDQDSRIFTSINQGRLHFISRKIIFYKMAS